MQIDGKKLFINIANIHTTLFHYHVTIYHINQFEFVEYSVFQFSSSITQTVRHIDFNVKDLRT